MRKLFTVTLGILCAVSIMGCSGRKNHTDAKETAETQTIIESQESEETKEAEETEETVPVVGAWAINTPDEAAKIVGFDIKVLDSEGEYTKRLINVIDKGMIEVDYLSSDGQKTVFYIRKSMGTDDISGDYNEYRNVETVKVGDYDVTEKGDEGNIFIATWTDGTYSYAIDTDRAELNAEDITNLIANIK